MAPPVALTEEVWDLAADPSLGRALLILVVSFLALSGFIWSLFYGSRIKEHPGYFVRRCVSAYLITFLVSFLPLFLFDKTPLGDRGPTLTPTILVALPASFAATAVDFMK
jgi:uncharacterized membrane protein